jgi:hypothetical protein
MALARCILGKFLGVGCHCVSTFSARCLHVQRRERLLVAEGGTLCGREMFGREFDFNVILGIYYMPQICDMGQTALLSLRRKACSRNFSPLKIRRLRPGLNPRTWVPKANMLTPRPTKAVKYIISYQNSNFIKIC